MQQLNSSHFPALSLGNSLRNLSLGFLICKMGLRVPSTTGDWEEPIVYMRHQEGAEWQPLPGLHLLEAYLPCSPESITCSPHVPYENFHKNTTSACIFAGPSHWLPARSRPLTAIMDRTFLNKHFSKLKKDDK